MSTQDNANKNEQLAEASLSFLGFGLPVEFYK